MESARSYLMGYFLGDGSCYHGNKGYPGLEYWFYENPDDKQRVVDNLRLLGIELVWRVSVKGRSVERAKLPLKEALFLDLNEVTGSCYTKRVPDLGWVDKKALIEGFWDADGCVSASKAVSPTGLPRSYGVGFCICNKGLADDFAELLKEFGFNPWRTDLITKTGGCTQNHLRLRKREVAKFAETFTLQPKKMKVLDRILRRI